MRVLKFGGTSVGSVECLQTALRIIEENARADRIVVVVSALSGVTNQLLDAVQQAQRGERVHERLTASLRSRHREMAGSFVRADHAGEVLEEQDRWLSRLSDLLLGVSLLHECPPPTRDAILSIGERLSLPLVVGALRSRGLSALGCDAATFLRTNDHHGDAGILFDESRKLAGDFFASLGPVTLPVVSGFIASTAAGAVTTLGRSGSDYTAALLGNFLDAESVEIWTDTDGVMSADPQIIREAVPLTVITYREAADLSLLGARVLHPRTVQPLETKGIPLTIRNTFRPQAAGTAVVKESPSPGEGVKSITSFAGAASITVRCNSGISTTGLYHRLFGVLDQLKVPVLTVHPSLSDGSISFLTLENRREEIVRALEEEFIAELERNAYAIETRDSLSIVTAVGDGVNSSPTVGRKFLETLERKNVRPVAIAQGISDLSLSAVVENGQERRAVKALHTTFIQRRQRVGLVIAGPTGKVGRALVNLLQDRQTWLREEHRLDLQIIGAVNTQRMIWEERGIAPHLLQAELKGAEPSDWSLCQERMRTYRSLPLVFLDCTASTFLARQYLALLEAEIGIVTPNKIANTLEYAYYEELRRVGRNRKNRYLYETTVGAATPMLQTLDDLRRTGDRIQKVEGVLSGTLSFVFSRVNQGERFSEAVREAARRGFTEPHPATDLSGEDVARKLLILAREAGYRLEREEISVEGLVPNEIQAVSDPEAYINSLSALDLLWEGLATRARTGGNRLTYLATFDGNRASVGIAEVPKESPFVRLLPSENAVHYYSDRHTPLPLTIQGVGAGPEVTARGVLADVLHTAAEMAA
jgi:aspartokinase/homoserine dehydrogenase 1